MIFGQKLTVFEKLILILFVISKLYGVRLIIHKY